MSTFFTGFACGVLFVILLCVALAMIKPEAIQRGASKFVIDLKARRLRNRVKQLNGEK